MRTSTAEVDRLLDRLFADRLTITKDELIRAAGSASVGDDALEAIRRLPEQEYTHLGLNLRLDDAVRGREDAREAGMSGHGEPGWRPRSVRRHPK